MVTSSSSSRMVKTIGTNKVGSGTAGPTTTNGNVPRIIAAASSSSSSSLLSPHPTSGSGSRMMKPPVSHTAGTKHAATTTTAFTNGTAVAGVPSSSSSSFSNAKLMYNEALQILNDETMLHACSLLLAPIPTNEDMDDDQDDDDDARSMDDIAINGITNGSDGIAVTTDHVVDDDTTTTTTVENSTEVLSTTTTEPVAVVEESSTRQNNNRKRQQQRNCSELGQLQRLYEQCHQAVITMEREGVILAQQKQKQQHRVLPPHLPLSTAGINSSVQQLLLSSSTSMQKPGMLMGGRTKIGGSHSRDGQHNNNNSVHRNNGVMRTASLKRPLLSSSTASISASTATSATTATTAQHLSIPPKPNGKGQFGSISGNATSSGVRRQRLERERSDSSVSTTATTVSNSSKNTVPTTTTTATKKSRTAGVDSSSISQEHVQQQQVNGITFDDMSIPPPNARQFLAMLNKNDATVSSKRKYSIDSDATDHDAPNPMSSSSSEKAVSTTTTKVNGMKRQSPEKKPSPPAVTTRIQPPRSSRK